MSVQNGFGLPCSGSAYVLCVHLAAKEMKHCRKCMQALLSKVRGDLFCDIVLHHNWGDASNTCWCAAGKACMCVKV